MYEYLKNNLSNNGVKLEFLKMNDDKKKNNFFILFGL